jgi:pimeloyl-ACP methyl ester carboxylesterase
MEDQATAIALALADLDVENATVVGHSLGATVATALVEQSPDLVTRVVDIDQAPDNSYGSLSFSAKLAKAPVIGQALNRLTDVAPDSTVRDQYEQAFAPGFNMSSGFDDPDQVVEDLREMTYTSYVDSANEEDDYADERPLSERLSSAEVPLLVIFGAEDQIYDPADEAIAPFEDIEGAQTKLIEGAGHSPQIEKPQETAALILAFIGQAERAAARQAALQKKLREAARAKRKAAKAKAQAPAPAPAKPKK